jgi:hypothetical protein
LGTHIRNDETQERQRGGAKSTLEMIGEEMITTNTRHHITYFKDDANTLEKTSVFFLFEITIVHGETVSCHEAPVRDIVLEKTIV